MKKSLILLFSFLITNLTYSQKSVLELKAPEELTSQDMYLLGQTYAEASYKRAFGNATAGFFFGFIAKGFASSSNKDTQKIRRLISNQKRIPPTVVLRNEFFIRGFNSTWKQKAINNMRQGELISYFGGLIFLTTI